MQKYIKIPYGIASFETLSSNNYHYVDRTNYIEILENMGERNISYLRPRRFGKSLFISMLKDYYDINKKHKFEDLFGKYYIGQHPTPLVNSYMILSFDFSGIATSTEQKAHKGFLSRIKNAANIFLCQYFINSDIETTLTKIEAEIEASMVMETLFAYLIKQENIAKIYVTIDEYDHFANELIAWNLDTFKSVVTGNGWVRKFYEVLKIAVGQGLVDRIFITGVSPITLDSLTSGFNIVKSLGGEDIVHEMMGFTKSEVEEIMLGVGATTENLPRIMYDLKNWYNGYLFCEDATERMYNPDMVLYFASSFVNKQKYPRKILDVNVVSDYGKIRQQFNIGGQEKKRLQILEDLLQNGEIISELTQQFSFETTFSNKDFISLLFYTGVVTIKGPSLDETIFCTPNYVIKQLYFDYFSQILAEETQLSPDALGYSHAVRRLLFDNNPEPLLTATSQIMQRLSNRDSMKFGEKHLKSIITAILMSSEAYYIHSELEVDKMYVDLFLERTVRFATPYQYLFEFKYYSKATYEDLVAQNKWGNEVQSARNQLQKYQQTDFFQAQKDLKSWLFMYVGHEAIVVELMNEIILH